MIATKECKIELNDHDHVVECIAWAPENAHQTINESIGNAVSILQLFFIWFVVASCNKPPTKLFHSLYIHGSLMKTTSAVRAMGDYRTVLSIRKYLWTFRQIRYVSLTYGSLLVS